VSPDRSLIATGGTAQDPSVRLWDAVTGEMFPLGGHDSYLNSVAFSPGGTRLASADNADKVWIWDVASHQPITSFQGDIPERGQLFSALYWLDEETLIGAGSDAVYWWDVTTGQLLERLARPEQAAFFVDASFSQGGNRLAGVAQDQNVYFWERAVGEWAIWPAQPDVSLGHVEFSSDGRLLVATAYSGALFVWDVDNQELLANDSVTTGDISAVRFSPDGRYLAVGGWDSVIWLWGIP
jgi:WD40 repeat protein